MGKVVKAVVGIGLIAVGIITGGFTLPLIGAISKGFLIATGAALALGAASEAFLAPKIPETQLGRLNVSFDLTTPRKAVFGTTAFPTDLRYHEATGTDQELIHYIICIAAHRVRSIDEIWLEQDLAWTAAGGITPKYDGYLGVEGYTEGDSGNVRFISANWGDDERLTGCAYIYLRAKRTGNSKTSESPLASGLPSRVTVKGEGAYLYDPRLDSTVPGGSGSHRSDDQSTWAQSYSPADSYDNPALQLLFWLLGWYINGKLSVGCGVPPDRIDMESFIAAANICDESVSLASGGTQPRYRTSGTASDGDDRMEIINTFLACMNGTLRDNGGRLSLEILKNDLAEYVLDFSDDDILDEFDWQQTKSLSQSYNVARGRFVDPSDNSLYQLVDYPEVSLASPDGIERVMPLDLPYVEDGRRAQRIAKQVLQRNQYRGTFSAVFSAKALGCDVGEIVRVTFAPLAFSNKLFRIVEKEINPDGRVPLVMVEENAAIYAWDDEDSAPVQATSPTVYDPLNSPFILADSELDDLVSQASADAAAAQADADAANASVTAITADNVLSRGEKPEIRKQRDAILDERPTIRARALALGVSVTTFDSEYTALINYLGTVDLDNATDTNITRTTFNQNFRDYYDARQDVLDGIAAQAALRADGVPLDNLVRQPTGENGVDAWFGVTASTDVPSIAPAGSRSLDIIDGGRQIDPIINGPLTGRRFEISAWVKTLNHTGGNFTLLPRTAAGGFVARTSISGHNLIIPTGQDWTFYSGVIEITGSDDNLVPAVDLTDYGGDNPRIWNYQWVEIPAGIEPNADVTIDAQITLTQPAAFDIQADSAGVTTTSLPTVTRSIRLYRGGVQQTSGVAVASTSATSGISVASASVSSGIVTVTLSTANASGSVTINVTFAGKTYPVTIDVRRTLAAPSGNTAPRDSYTDTTWAGKSGTSFSQIAGDGRVSTNSSGQVSIRYNASYTGGRARCKVQYRPASGGTWTDVSGSDVTGTAPINIPGEEEPGFISYGFTTLSGLTADLQYDFRLMALSVGAGALISWQSPTFQVNEPA